MNPPQPDDRKAYIDNVRQLRHRALTLEYIFRELTITAIKIQGHAVDRQDELLQQLATDKSTEFQALMKMESEKARNYLLVIQDYEASHHNEHQTF